GKISKTVSQKTDFLVCGAASSRKLEKARSMGIPIIKEDDLESFLSNGSPMPHFEKVHAGKDMEALFDQTDAAATLLSREVRVVLDRSNR
ncbi:MAG: BRCT domain-containing protein, partial [Bacteroidota bacterium]